MTRHLPSLAVGRVWSLLFWALLLSFLTGLFVVAGWCYCCCRFVVSITASALPLPLAPRLLLLFLLQVLLIALRRSSLAGASPHAVPIMTRHGVAIQTPKRGGVCVNFAGIYRTVPKLAIGLDVKDLLEPLFDVDVFCFFVFLSQKIQ